MEKDRKTLIADTAIALLGELGARGLTHRAVDTQAQLPAGSTSFYCRSRLELLTLALQRHAALDMADLVEDGPALSRPDLSTEDFVDILAARVTDWLSPGKRLRLVARFELFLIASREPGLATVVEQQRQLFLQATAAALKKGKVPRASQAALSLLMMVDGMLLDQIRAPEVVVTAAQRKAALKAAIQLPVNA